MHNANYNCLITHRLNNIKLNFVVSIIHNPKKCHDGTCTCAQYMYGMLSIVHGHAILVNNNQII